MPRALELPRGRDAARGRPLGALARRGVGGTHRAGARRARPRPRRRPGPVALRAVPAHRVDRARPLLRRVRPPPSPRALAQGREGPPRPLEDRLVSPGRSVGSDRQPSATAFGYVSGWHNGPTPERCSGSATNPNGDVLACTHASHTKDPQPVSKPVHNPSRSVYLPGDAGWRPAEERQLAFRLASPAGVLLTPAEPESELWFAQRRGGITATDLPKILGFSDYGNALSVWLDKRGELAWDEAGEAARWGTLLEDVVAREWARRREVKVRRIGVLRNADDPWMRASLDRVVTGCSEP
ncbi:MAG: hypothetical protein EOP01_07020, partial [Propionibacteriaceae bacterium]